MKRFALLALLIGACSSPPEIDEISNGLYIQLSNPFPNNVQNIFVGYRADLDETGVVFQRLPDNYCRWIPMSPHAGTDPLYDFTVFGGNLHNFMAHVQDPYWVGCTHGDLVGYMSYPFQDNGYVIDLVGGPADDWINCGGSAGVENSCTGAGGNDTLMAVSYHAWLTGGPGNDKFGLIGTPISNVHVYGNDGNDCVTWSGNVAGPTGDGGTGTDTIKSRALSPSSVNYEADDTTSCGGLYTGP